MSSLALLAEKKRRIERERSGPAWGPVDPIAAHVRNLLAAGWTRVEIAKYSGINRRTLYAILDGDRRFVNRHTAASLLAVQAEDAPRRIPATGTMRRIQGLSAIGWTGTQIARDAGLGTQFLRDVVSGRYQRIPRDKADAVKRVCRARYLMPGPSKTARTVAARNGWVPVTAWDDIDDPTEKPEGVAT